MNLRQIAAMTLAAAGVFLLTGLSCAPPSTPAIGYESHQSVGK